MSTQKIVADEGAQLDFSRDMSYGDYLHLDEVLNAQHPLSPEHNEMLFIVQHQTSELWMKLMLHELGAAVQRIANDDLGTAFKMLARVSRIMEQLVHAWDVLATMTPPDAAPLGPWSAPAKITVAADPDVGRALLRIHPDREIYVATDLPQAMEIAAEKAGTDKAMVFDGCYGAINMTRPLAEYLIARAPEVARRVDEELMPKWLRQRNLSPAA